MSNLDNDNYTMKDVIDFSEECLKQADCLIKQARSYHNTTGEKTRLQEFNKKAKTQDRLILSFFQCKNVGMSASYVYDKLKESLKGAPITSVRRSITNLKKIGLLEKTERRTRGQYGRSESVYIVNRSYLLV